MAKRTTRDKYKRQLEGCVKLLNNVQDYLSDMFRTYHETHPEVSLQVALLLEATEELKKAIENFNKEL